ncbi:hypothetical protein B0T19DRAFT_488646 [Cercophora scortea]|uniref:Uncharacterized protein n=1 Tax=Cercophora scortea TaxID=314031 RepID=A0AAE0I2T0_9PEZI|nr:hypothetical protein B0T19DRAFT_488646 [Cercophora scortea]
MDPITAIGLASGILSFLNFSASLVQGAISIHDSLDGDLEENRSLEMVVGEMKQLSTLLLSPDDSKLVGPEKGLCGLASECRALSSRLLELLEKIKPKDSSSKTQSLWSALKNKMYEKEKLELEQRLDYCRGVLELHLTFLTSRETRTQLTLLIESAQEDASKLQKVQETMDQLSHGVELASISETAKEQIRQLVQVQDDVLCKIAQSQILKSLAFDEMHSRYNMVEEAHSSTFAWIFGDKHDAESEGEYDSDEETNDEEESDGGSSSDAVDLDDERSETEDKETAGEAIPNDSKEALSQTIGPQNESEEAGQEPEPHPVIEAGAVDGEPKDDSASEPAVDSEIDIKLEIAEKFKTWLSSGSGVFHISGKLGCGKSTLMKFLCEHPGTKAELSRWAGDKTLVMASFFFWKPGSELQKSLFGLMRGLLHEVLQTCPDLIPAVLPDHWKKTRETPWMAQAEFYLSEKDYTETPQQDRKAVLELLCGWARASPASIKLCVSSREDNVFMNNLSAEQRLRLHDLTRDDMESYVRERLTDLPEGEEKERLIREIPEKAQGIFLWVTLVVRSIREELENGASIAALILLLDSFPDELEALFEHIIRSFRSTRERKKAYQTFAMLSLSKQHLLGFSLFQYSFYESYEADNQFAMRQNFPDTFPVDDHAALERLERARKSLNGNSKGLLETKLMPMPQDASRTFRGRDEHIDYSHRSIPEFLQKPAMKAEMASHIEGLRNAEVLSQLVLADIRLSRHFWQEENLAITPLVTLRLQEHLDHPPYEFLESVLASYHDIGNRIVKDSDLADGGTYLTPLNRGAWQITSQKEIDSTKPSDSRLNHYLIHPILATVLVGHYEYFKWKLERDKDLLRRPAHATLAAYVAMLANNMTSWKIVEYFLENDFFTILTRSELRCGRTPPHRHELSIWHHYLASEFIVHYVWDEALDTNPKGSHGRFSHIAESFLERGADPYFTATATATIKSSRPVTGGRATNYRCVLELGLERKVIVINEGGSDDRTTWAPARLDGFSQEDASSKAESESDSPRTRSLSLGTWIEYLDPPNKEHLLFLIERNKQRLKSSDEGAETTQQLDNEQETINPDSTEATDASAQGGMTAEDPTTGLEPKGKISESQSLSLWYYLAFILGPLLIVLMSLAWVWI